MLLLTYGIGWLAFCWLYVTCDFAVYLLFDLVCGVMTTVVCACVVFSFVVLWVVCFDCVSYLVVVVIAYILLLVVQ